MGNTTNNNNCKKSPSNKAQERHRLILKTPLHLTPFIVHYRLRILIASFKSKHKTLKTNGSNIKLVPLLLELSRTFNSLIRKIYNNFSKYGILGSWHQPRIKTLSNFIFTVESIIKRIPKLHFLSSKSSRLPKL